MGFFAWLAADIRNWIMVILGVIVIALVIYCGFLRWDVAVKDSAISELKVTNAQLILNNTNLTAQNEQLKTANEALKNYAANLLKIKGDLQKIRDSIGKIGSKEDEIKANNDLVDLWSAAVPK